MLNCLLKAFANLLDGKIDLILMGDSVGTTFME